MSRHGDDDLEDVIAVQDVPGMNEPQSGPTKRVRRTASARNRSSPPFYHSWPGVGWFFRKKYDEDDGLYSRMQEVRVVETPGEDEILINDTEKRACSTKMGIFLCIALLLGVVILAFFMTGGEGDEDSEIQQRDLLSMAQKEMEMKLEAMAQFTLERFFICDYTIHLDCK